MRVLIFYDRYIMLSEREHIILEAVVREYICNAMPVSSRTIADQENYDISPATIRNSMMQLEERGYLVQPHKSAGRLPTQQGYRYFVDHCISQDDITLPIRHRLRELTDIHDVLRFVTSHTHLFNAIIEHESGSAICFGIEEVLQSPEFNDSNNLRMFGKLIDTIEISTKQYRSKLHNEIPCVFIEHENPIPEAQALSVIITPLGNNTHTFLSIGPSRMNYGYAIAAARSLMNDREWDIY
jgi:transcriptional regulator of heat shock response